MGPIHTAVAVAPEVDIPYADLSTAFNVGAGSKEYKYMIKLSCPPSKLVLPSIFSPLIYPS
jgi:hypothetical protein